MAEIEVEAEAGGKDMRQKAKETVASNKRNIGIGAAAALFGAGYLVGHKRAENTSLYDKIMRQIR